MSLSDAARARLMTCDPRLRLVVELVAERWPVQVVCGHRGREAQDAAHAAGRSRTPWPRSAHNSDPSRAVDACPTELARAGGSTIDWADRERFSYFAGWVVGTAAARGIRLRWGGDWDRDTEVKDNRFDDLVHFELDEP